MAKADWVAIQRDATSDNSLTRKHSLSQAVTELEKALIASGVNCEKERKKRRSLADMFLDHMEKEDQLEILAGNMAMQKDNFGDLLRTSIAARNKGVHSDKEVAESQCEQFVEIIHAAWQLLRDRFVTRSKASAFAKLFLESSSVDGCWDPYGAEPPVLSPNFADIYLYGSLARSAERPNDIDLLLVDASGEIIYRSGYSVDTTDKEQSILSGLDESESERKYCTPRNVAAIECGWLNLSLISHRFGHDRAWTEEIAALERDPLFFLNIARDMLRYDPTHNDWTRDFGSLPVFGELATLRDRLAEIGIVSGPAGLSGARQAELAITIICDNATIAKVDQVRKTLVKGEYLSRRTILDWALQRSLREVSDDPISFLRLLRSN